MFHPEACRRRLRFVSALVDGLDLKARIARLVEQQLPELIQLIDDALERQLAALVADRLNGHGNGPVRTAPATGDSTVKTCRRCQTTKAVSEFHRHRAVCKACRRVEQRTRARRTAQEPPRPDDGEHATGTATATG
jgi:hypothetical protein